MLKKIIRNIEKNLVHRRSLPALLASALVAWVGVGFSSTAVGQVYFPPTSTDNWRSLVSGPDITPSQGQKDQIAELVRLDWNELREAHEYSRSFFSAASLLVIRDGWVAGEWGNTSQDTNAASVTKSLTSLAYAKLWDLSSAGQLGSLIGPESNAQDYLPTSWASQDPDRADVRIRHLLTMSSGIQQHDFPVGDSYNVEFILGRPMQDSPGTVWAYSSLGVDLAGIILQDVAGQSLGAFSQQNIFDPIGASLTWEAIPNSVYDKASTNTVGSNYDFARIAYLLLNNGRWNGQQIVSSQNVALITRPAPQLSSAQFATTPGSPFVVADDSPEHFGYLYWSNATQTALGGNVPPDAFYAHGFGEDLVVVIPSLNMVVVRMGNRPTEQAAVPFRSEFMRLIMDAVLPEAGNAPPERTAAIADQQGEDGDVFSLDVSANFSDPDGDTLGFAAAGLPASLSIVSASGVISGVLTAADGAGSPYTVTVTATDPGGLSVSDSFTITVASVNRAPALASAIADQQGLAGDAFSLNVSANFSDPDGDMLNFSAAGLPVSLSMAASNGVISGTFGGADAAASPFIVTVTATDPGGLSVSDSFRITVGSINDAPTVTSAIPDQQGTEGDAFSLDVSDNFADPNGDSLSFAASGLPSGLSMAGNSGVIAGSLSAADVTGSPYTVTVTATDPGGLSVNNSFAVTVVGVNDAPQLVNAIGDQQAVEHQPFNLDISANFSDPDGDSLIFAATALPPSLSIDANTGVISGITDDIDLVGSPHSVTVTASDPGGLTASDSFSITVPNVNDAPVFTSMPLTGVTEAVEYFYGVTADDADGDTVEIAAVTLPDWLALTVLNDRTAELRGMPTGDHVGDHPVELSVRDPSGAINPQLFTIKVLAAADGPVINLLGDSSITINVGDTYTDPGAEANDPQDGDLTNLISTDNPVDGGVAGNYTVTYSVTDSAGNSVQSQRTVSVVAKPDPVPVPQSGGGGGGSVLLELLGLLVLSGATRLFPRGATRRTRRPGKLGGPGLHFGAGLCSL